MSIIDTIKNSVLSQFTNTVSIPGILMSLAVSFAIAVYILYIYRKTFAGIVYNRGMVLCLVLLSMVTAMIIRTINSNLSLSLGMVGALSIVRFRTAIKEPVDTAFLFWAITAGIMSGAGLYVIAIIASLALGLLYYVIYCYGAKAKSQYMLVVSCSIDSIDAVREALKSVKTKKLRSQSTNEKGMAELTYEIGYDKSVDAVMARVQNVAGVKNVNLITYQNEFGI